MTCRTAETASRRSEGSSAIYCSTVAALLCMITPHRFQKFCISCEPDLPWQASFCDRFTRFAALRQRKSATGLQLSMLRSLGRSMSEELRQLLQTSHLSAERQQHNFQTIHTTVLTSSPYMKSANFRTFHADDLKFMFQQYDQLVLNGACGRALNGRPLTFHLSKRMTRAGGKTSWKSIRDRRTGSVREEFEISVSSHLLFQTFRNETRSVTVTGLECTDRLQAMQRIVEHEIVHLSEQLAWRSSSCRAARFQSIAVRLFGHQAHTHDLVTTAEVAHQHGVRRGSRVAFEFEGRRYQGIVNRITTRVTVLVASPQGERYSDGNRYMKFYIPLNMLQNPD